MKDTMDIINLIIKDPSVGFILAFQLALLGLVIAGMVWLIVGALRWALAGRGINLPGGFAILAGKHGIGPDQKDRRKSGQGEEILKAIKGAAWIVSKVEAMKRAIVVAQKDAIAERRPFFNNVLKDHNLDPIFTRLFLWEWETVFNLAADYNHILEKVDLVLRRIDPVYLTEKLGNVENRYRSTCELMAGERGTCVDWEDLRQDLEDVARLLLLDYARVAEDHRNELTKDINAIKDNLGVNNAMGQYLDGIVSEIR